MITPTQSICADIPQILLEALQDYLAQHPDWDKNRVVAAALSLFLLQNGEGDRRASKVYLDTLFRPSVPATNGQTAEVVAANGETATTSVERNEDLGAIASSPSASSSAA